MLESYLTKRKQSVVLNGCISEQLPIIAGVPQGSVLGPLLFLIYINDIADDLSSDSFLFADDTSMFEPAINSDISAAAHIINNNLAKILAWADQWLVSINCSKTVVTLFSRRRSPSKLPPIKLGDTCLENVQSHKHLGMFFVQTQAGLSILTIS